MTILIVSVVVNPKTGEPFFATVSDVRGDRHFSIRDLNGDREGGGYFETDRASSYYESAEATGYPRIHTPEGVATKGTGNGTCLYVAGSTVVYAGNHAHEDALSIRTGVPRSKSHDGVSSTEERSDAASEWWERAVDRGLASHVEFAKPDETIEVASDCLYGKDLRKAANDLFGAAVPGDANTENLRICIDVSYSVSSDEAIKCDILEYTDAYDRNLVCGVCLNPLKWIGSELSPQGVELPNKHRINGFMPAVARAVNVGIFHTYADPDASFALWSRICVQNGMNRSDYEQMVMRYREAIDLDPRAMTYGVERPNPAPRRPKQRTKADPFAGIVKSYAPRRNPAPSANGDVRRELAESLLEERRRLGWDRLSNLP